MDNLDTPVADLELSTRARTVLLNNGVATLREMTPEKFEFFRKHVRNYGRKTENELKEIIRWMRERQGDLFMTPKELAIQLADTLVQIQAIIHDVQVRMLQVSLNRRVSIGVKNEMAVKLHSAAEYCQRLPAGRPNSEHPYDPEGTVNEG